MTEPVVRELRVTDISCVSCGALPAEECRFSRLEKLGLPPVAHGARIREFEQLVDEGWQWQEVDSTDIGAKR